VNTHYLVKLVYYRSMRLTVLGGCGAWPDAGTACSGYLIEHDGFLLLVDPGYAILPRLLSLGEASAVDAVLVSHGHPDHCADLNPLLRARALADSPARPLPVLAPPNALDAVLSLDRPGMLDDALELREFVPGASFDAGPFSIRSWLLPHWEPNAGLRIQAADTSIAYTGDTGPTPDLVDLARDADLFLAEATYPDLVPADSAKYLSSARQAGRVADAAGAGRLLLTHLWPGTDPATAIAAAATGCNGPIAVAAPGLTETL
jgi:ribonuclease BN (tRNA processing enzyme)